MLKKWWLRLKCWFKGGHEIVETRQVRYLPVFGTEAASEFLPITITNRYCTRCAPPVQ